MEMTGPRSFKGRWPASSRRHEAEAGSGVHTGPARPSCYCWMSPLWESIRCRARAVEIVRHLVDTQGLTVLRARPTWTRRERCGHVIVLTRQVLAQGQRATLLTLPAIGWFVAELLPGRVRASSKSRLLDDPGS